MKKRNRNLVKRALSVCLSLSMCLGMLQITAFAVEGEETEAAEKWTVTTPSGKDVEIEGSQTDKEWNGANEDGTVKVEGSKSGDDELKVVEGSEEVEPEDGYQTESNTIPDNNGQDPAENQSGEKVETQITTTEWEQKTTETETITETTTGAADAGKVEVDGTWGKHGVEEADKELKPAEPGNMDLDLTVKDVTVHQNETASDKKSDDNVQKAVVEALKPDTTGYVLNDNGDLEYSVPVEGGTKVTTVKEVKDKAGNVIGYTTTVRTETTVKDKVPSEIASNKLSSEVLNRFQDQNNIPKEGSEITRPDGTKATVTKVEYEYDSKGTVKGYKVITEAKSQTETEKENILTDAEAAGQDVVHNTLESAPAVGGSYTFADGKEANVTSVVPVYADDDPTKLIGYTVTAQVDGEQYTDEQGNPVIPTVTRTETISLSAKDQMTDKTTQTVTDKTVTTETSTMYVYFDEKTNTIVTEEILTQTAAMDKNDSTLSVSVEMGEVNWTGDHGIMYEEGKKVVGYDEYDEVVKKEVWVQTGDFYGQGHYELREEIIHHKYPIYATDENGDYIREDGKYEVVPGTSFGDRVSNMDKNMNQDTTLAGVEAKFDLITRDDIKAAGVTVTQNNLSDNGSDKFTTSMKVDLSISKSQLTDSYLYLDIQDSDGKTVRRAYLTEDGKAYWKDGHENPQEVKVTVDENTGAITGVEFTDIPVSEGENKLQLQLFGYQKTYAHKDLNNNPTNPQYGDELEYTKSGLKIVDDGYTVIDLRGSITVTISGIKAKIETEHTLTGNEKEDHVYTRQEKFVQNETVETTEVTTVRATTAITDIKTTSFSLAHSNRPGTPEPTDPDPTERDDDDEDDDDDDTTIPDTDVPLTGGSEETAINDEEVPLAELPEETSIEDDEVPLAELPEEAVIEDDEVPLADVPETGDISAMWYAVTILSACGLMGLHILKKREEA